MPRRSPAEPLAATPLHRRRLQTPLLHRLTAARFAPETVDLVINTHLHVDHIGWNTHLVDSRWTPTFPNARYVTDRREWDY